jgi:hypothetical protein
MINCGSVIGKLIKMCGIGSIRCDGHFIFYFMIRELMVEIIREMLNKFRW